MNQTYLLKTFIADAYLKGATCIHFESQTSPEKCNILLRIDKVLLDYIKIPEALAEDIIKIIKSMANLNVEDCCLPKIGHIKFKHDGLPEFMLTVITSPNGGQREAVNLRIQTA
jgi:type II secretory ATPase GspE/PulE/Tfp pilus assembly ATPase PilB-like protein